MGWRSLQIGLLLAAVATAAGAQIAPRAASVCDLTGSQQATFDGQVVVVRARISAYPGQHYQMLEDDDCEGDVVLFTTQELQGGADHSIWPPFTRAVTLGDVQVEATFTGLFRMRGPGSGLAVTEIADVRVTPFSSDPR